MSPNFVDAFLQGMQRGSSGPDLLSQFVRREILNEQLKGLKEQQKELDTLVKVETTNALNAQQQNQMSPEQTDLLNALLQGGYADATISNQQARSAAAGQAETAQKARLAESNRIQAQERNRKNFNRVGYQINLRGQDLADFTDLMTAEFPNEEARELALRQRFPKWGETELDRIQLERARLGLEYDQLRLRQLKAEIAAAAKEPEISAATAARLGQLDVRYAGPNGVAVFQDKVELLSNVLKAVPTGDDLMDDEAVAAAAKKAGVSVPEMIGAAIPLNATPLGETMQGELNIWLESGNMVDTWLATMQGTGQLGALAVQRLQRRGIMPTTADEMPEPDTPEYREIVEAQQQEMRAIAEAAHWHVVKNGSALLEPVRQGPIGAGTVFSRAQERQKAQQRPPTTAEPEPTSEYDNVATESLQNIQKAKRERLQVLEKQKKTIKEKQIQVTPSQQEGKGIGRRKPTVAEAKKLKEIEIEIEQIETDLNIITDTLVARARESAVPRGAVPPQIYQ